MKVNIDLHITTLTGILPHQGPFQWVDISSRIGTSSLPSKWGSSTLGHACGGILSGLMLGTRILPRRRGRSTIVSRGSCISAEMVCHCKVHLTDPNVVSYDDEET